ncbi:MAG: DNA polymerase V [Acidimicrobiales bacterium]|jgi:DNA polymerase V
MSMIGLMDCNNFFVSCERLFRPDLEGKPVAVLSSNDGCVVARSQEVKDLGIAMGVPLFQVKDVCKKEEITLFSGNITLYRDISARVMQVLAQEVGECEIYSIDEAFFTLPDGVTESEVHAIRDVVIKNVGIPVSIGVAKTKTLAKHASSVGKKGDGVCVLTQEDWEVRAKEVKCVEIWGLGRQTTAKLSEKGIRTVSEFMKLNRGLVSLQFGVSGERVYDELHGTSVVRIDGNSEASRKSIASTRSFAKTTKNLQDLESAVAGHVTHCAESLRKRGVVATKVLVQIQTDRYGDFFMQGDSAEIVFDKPTSTTSVLLTETLKHVRSMYREDVPYKKTGVSFSSLIPEAYMTTTLYEQEEEKDMNVLDAVIDGMNERFGKGMIRSAAILESRAKSNAQLRSPAYTTQWKDIPSVVGK